MSDSTPQPQFLSRRELRERAAAQAAAQGGAAGETGGVVGGPTAGVSAGTSAVEPQVSPQVAPQAGSATQVAPEFTQNAAPVAPMWQPVRAEGSGTPAAPDFMQAHRMVNQEQTPAAAQIPQFPQPSRSPQAPQAPAQPSALSPQQEFPLPQFAPPEAQPMPEPVPLGQAAPSATPAQSVTDPEPLSVPQISPEGRPLSRRELRELREQQQGTHVAPRPGDEEASQWHGAPDGVPDGAPGGVQSASQPADEVSFGGPQQGAPKFGEQQPEGLSDRAKLDALLQRAEAAERANGVPASAELFSGLNGRTNGSAPQPSAPGFGFAQSAPDSAGSRGLEGLSQGGPQGSQVLGQGAPQGPQGAPQGPQGAPGAPQGLPQGAPAGYGQAPAGGPNFNATPQGFSGAPGQHGQPGQPGQQGQPGQGGYPGGYPGAPQGQPGAHQGQPAPPGQSGPQGQPGYGPTSQHQGAPVPSAAQPANQAAQPMWGPTAAAGQPGATGDFAGSFPSASGHDIPQVAQGSIFDVDDEDLHGKSFDWRHIVGLLLVAAIIGVLVWMMINKNSENANNAASAPQTAVVHVLDQQRGAPW